MFKNRCLQIGAMLEKREAAQVNNPYAVIH